MTALARSIGTQETVLYLNSALDVGSLPAPYLIDSEAVLVTGGDLQTLIYVSRGQFGTAPAAHALGTSLVAGWGGGGGDSVVPFEVKDGTDTVFEVDTDAGNTYAQLNQTSDVQTLFYVGDQNKSGYTQLVGHEVTGGLVRVTDSAPIVRAQLSADGNGLGLIDASGNAASRLEESGLFAKDANGNERATATIFGLSLADQNGVPVLQMYSDSPQSLGFFGAASSPVAQPVVPLTLPTLQNVIDALVALGLVAQHD